MSHQRVGRADKTRAYDNNLKIGLKLSAACLDKLGFLSERDIASQKRARDAIHRLQIGHAHGFMCDARALLLKGWLVWENPDSF
jgi:hypothetical protein